MKETLQIQNLIEYGFNRKEALIVDLLSRQSPLKIAEVAKILEIPRSTAYDNIYALLKKGFLKTLKGSDTDRFELAPKQSFTTMIKDTREALELKEDSIESFFSTVSSVSIKDLTSDVHFYQGRKGLEQVMWNTLAAKGEIIGTSVLGRVDIIGASFHKEYEKQLKEKKIRDRVVINPTKRTLSYVRDINGGALHHLSLLDIKVIDEKTFKIHGDLMIYNNVVAQMFWRENEIFAFEIENPFYAQMQRELIRLVWEQSDEVDKYL